MPARTTSPRLPKVRDIQERLRANIEARAQVEYWARQGIAHAEAGRIAKAKKAHEKAQHYMAKLIERERDGR